MLAGSIVHKRIRKRLRMEDFDYSTPGVYFVTLCTRERYPWFGNIVDTRMQLNSYGTIVYNTWQNLPDYFPGLTLDAFIVMPDHLHGIFILTEKTCYSQSTRQLHPTLSNIIGRFKGLIRRSIQDRDFSWQKSFYDTILVNEQALNNVRSYIKENPVHWEEKLIGIHNAEEDEFYA